MTGKGFAIFPLLNPAVVFFQIELAEGVKKMHVSLVEQHQPLHDATMDDVIGGYLHIGKNLKGFSPYHA